MALSFLFSLDNHAKQTGDECLALSHRHLEEVVVDS
jgi:hypothetical protein